MEAAHFRCKIYTRSSYRRREIHEVVERDQEQEIFLLTRSLEAGAELGLRVWGSCRDGGGRGVGGRELSSCGGLRAKVFGEMAWNLL